MLKYKGCVLVAWTILFATSLLTVSLYWIGLDGPFILDDFANLGSSRITEFSWEGIQNWWHAGGGMPSRRPLSFLTFAANIQVFGNNSFYFKLTNLAIHLCIGLLLYALSQRLLGLLLYEQSTNQLRLFAALIAALWLLHPMHVSTVLYIVQRMAQLSALFTVLAILSYLSLRQALLTQRHRAAVAHLIILVLVSLAALASKQNGVLIPVFILLIEIALLHTQNSALHDRRTTILVACTSVFPIAAGFIAAVSMHEYLMLYYERRTFTLEERLATEFRILWDYVRQLLLPRLSSFGLYRNDVVLSDFTDTSTWFALASWILTIVAAFFARTVAPLFFFGVLWFLGAHSLESTIIPLELQFEHRNYLASFGIIVALTQFIVFASKANARAGVAILVLVFAAALSFQTFTRATTWADYLRLARTAVEEHPHSPRAHAVYGAALADLGMFDEAIEQFETGQELDPDEAGFPLHALLVACHAGLDTRSYYDNALQTLRTSRISVHATNTLVMLHKTRSTKQCTGFGLPQMRDLLDAAVNNPDGRTVPRNHAALLRLRGILHAWQLDNFEEGFRDLKASIEVYPEWQRTRLNLVQTLIRYRRYGEALAWIEKFQKSPTDIAPRTRDELQSLRSVTIDLQVADPPDDGYRPPLLNHVSPWSADAPPLPPDTRHR